MRISNYPLLSFHLSKKLRHTFTTLSPSVSMFFLSFSFQESPLPTDSTQKLLCTQLSCSPPSLYSYRPFCSSMFSFPILSYPMRSKHSHHTHSVFLLTYSQMNTQVHVYCHLYCSTQNVRSVCI